VKSPILNTVRPSPPAFITHYMLLRVGSRSFLARRLHSGPMAHGGSMRRDEHPRGRSRRAPVAVRWEPSGMGWEGRGDEFSHQEHAHGGP
jgi:hypothetical protein